MNAVDTDVETIQRIITGRCATIECSNELDWVTITGSQIIEGEFIPAQKIYVEDYPFC